MGESIKNSPPVHYVLSLFSSLYFYCSAGGVATISSSSLPRLSLGFGSDSQGPSLAAEPILDPSLAVPGAIVTLRHVEKCCGLMGWGGSHDVGFVGSQPNRPCKPLPAN